MQLLGFELHRMLGRFGLVELRKWFYGLVLEFISLALFLFFQKLIRVHLQKRVGSVV